MIKLNDHFKQFYPFIGTIVVILGLVSFGQGARAAGDVTKPAKQAWTFNGLTGTWDRAQLQRGYQVYKEVCSSCHSLSLLSYRNLEALGFSEPEVKAIAAQYTVVDGPNDLGEMVERPGVPSDRFVSPYPNAQAARLANNGALPPDMSLVVNARKYDADYVYSLLTGYETAPEDFTIGEGLYFNRYFPGYQIAMAPPLINGQVEYSDGTPETIEQMSRDVTAFLHWAANPKMEERKRMGLMVLIYMVIFTILMYFTMKRVWSRVED